MSGSGVWETPNAAFAALSAQVLRSDRTQGLPSSISESQSYLDCGDDKSFTESLDRRCRAFDGQGLSKLDKVTLTNVAMFKPSNNVDKWLATVWSQLLMYQGSALLQQWIHMVNYLDNSLQPPLSIMHTAVHKFTPQDADTATLEAMLEKGELIGTSAESFLPNRPRALSVSDEVEVLLEMPTEDEEETRDEWVDRQATVVKVEDDRYLVHSNVRPTDVSAQWFLAMRMRKAP